MPPTIELTTKLARRAVLATMIAEKANCGIQMVSHSATIATNRLMSQNDEGEPWQYVCDSDSLPRFLVLSRIDEQVTVGTAETPEAAGDEVAEALQADCPREVDEVWDLDTGDVLDYAITATLVYRDSVRRGSPVV